MGVTPMAGAAAAICAAASTLIALCSMSMNSQSKPQVAAADAMSTVRAWRRPRPSARRPSFSRCLARLGCMARSLWNYEDLRYNGFRYITGCVIRMKRNHSHPGIVLLEQFLKPSGLSQNALARDIGVPPRRINEINLRKRGITAETALRLSKDLRHSAPHLVGPEAEFRRGG